MLKIWPSFAQVTQYVWYAAATRLHSVSCSPLQSGAPCLYWRPRLFWRGEGPGGCRKGESPYSYRHRMTGTWCQTSFPSLSSWGTTSRYWLVRPHSQHWLPDCLFFLFSLSLFNLILKALVENIEHFTVQNAQIKTKTRLLGLWWDTTKHAHIFRIDLFSSNKGTSNNGTVCVSGALMGFPECIDTILN